MVQNHCPAPSEKKMKNVLARKKIKKDENSTAGGRGDGTGNHDGDEFGPPNRCRSIANMLKPFPGWVRERKKMFQEVEREKIERKYMVKMHRGKKK